MKRMVLGIAALAALVGGTNAARADGHGAPPPAIDDAVRAAKDSGKALVLEFYTTWCHPCKIFASQVLSRPEVKTALTSVMFVRYDAEAGPGIAAAARFNVRAYPTLLVLDGSGRLVTRQEGTLPVNGMLQFVAQADLDVLDARGIARRVKANPDDPGVLIGAARWHRAHGETDRAETLYDRAALADHGNHDGVAATARWEGMELRRYHRVRHSMMREWADYVARYPSSDKALAVLATVAVSGEVPKQRVAGLAKLVESSIGDDAPALNQAIYIFLASGAKDAALSAARRQAALIPTQANPHDSLAEALYYAGKKSDAVAESKKAVKLAPADQKPIYRANLNRFEGMAFTTSPDVDSNLTRASAMLRALPGDDPHDQRPPQKAPRPADLAAIQARAFYSAASRVFDSAAAACKARAGKLEEVYVRLELDGATPKRVVVLEPGAPHRLKKCLVRELKAAALPPAPKRLHDRLTLPVRFASDTD